MNNFLKQNNIRSNNFSIYSAWTRGYFPKRKPKFQKCPKNFYAILFVLSDEGA